MTPWRRSTLAIFGAVLLAASIGCTNTTAEPGEIVRNQAEVSIRGLLNAQRDAWNAGNLDGYMSHYKRSDETTHILNGHVTTGFDVIDARLREMVPDTSDMGTLSYGDITIDVITKETAIAAAPWNYRRGAVTMSGYFTIVLEKIDKRWYIVHDHSSTALPGA